MTFEKMILESIRRYVGMSRKEIADYLISEGEKMPDRESFARVRIEGKTVITSNDAASDFMLFNMNRDILAEELSKHPVYKRLFPDEKEKKPAYNIVDFCIAFKPRI